MKPFIFPSPFPEPLQTYAHPTPEPATLVIGPIDAERAVRIFWKLKRLDIRISWSQNVVYTQHNSNGDVLQTIHAINESASACVSLSASTQYAAARQPVERCLPSSDAFAAFESTANGGDPFLSKPFYWQQYPDDVPDEKRLYCYELWFNVRNSIDVEQGPWEELHSCTTFGMPFSENDERYLYKTAASQPVSVLGFETTANFSILKGMKPPDYFCDSSHIVSAEWEFH